MNPAVIGCFGSGIIRHHPHMGDLACVVSSACNTIEKFEKKKKKMVCFFCTCEKKKKLFLHSVIYFHTHTYIYLDIVFSSTVCGNDHSLDAAIFHLKKGGSSRINCLLFLRWTNGTLLCDSERREALHLDMSLGLRLTHPSQGNW